MIESFLFMVATTFLTVLAFLMVLVYLGIIKLNVKKEANIRLLTKEERKEYGWVKLNFDFNILGKKFKYKTKRKNEN